MKSGGGKQKGNQFERNTCRALSLWITGGKREDVLWRTSMSGGRATVARKRGKSVKQDGDISAIAAEGHIFSDNWFVECKFHKKLDIASLLITNTGDLIKYWHVACREASHHKKFPMLIFKSNRMPTMVVVATGAIEQFTRTPNFECPTIIKPKCFDIWHFETLLKTIWARV